MSDVTWVGTSWKMTKTIAEAVAYADALAEADLPAGVQPFVLPAHTSLAAVRDALPPDSRVLLGAQNAHWAPEGAGTGEISMRMAADAGARIVEIGHSERRAAFGETDATVALKVRAALDAGLLPLVCVGESESARAAGDPEQIVTAQVQAALGEVSAREIAEVLVAYEPIWAIGSGGRPATPEEVGPVLRAAAAEIGRLSGGEGCRAVLYGGSVDEHNAAELVALAEADGLFVGRAAWDVGGFLRLLRVAASAR